MYVSLDRVRANYTSLGDKAAQKYDVSPGPHQWSPFTCGTDMGNQTDYCQCTGTMYFGLANDLITKKENDFDSLRLWNYKTKYSDGSERQLCDISTFGGVDQWRGKPKVCMCEPQPFHYPHKCADEGEECMCKGDVYFMSNVNQTSKGPNPHYLHAAE
jgi:hypothetical protein